MRHIILALIFIVFSLQSYSQSQAELDWANLQMLNGLMTEDSLETLGFAFTDEDEDNSYETPNFSDGVFIPTLGSSRLGFEHSTGTKQYLWIRCKFSDTDHRSGSPNEALINEFNRWMWQIQKISYQQFGINRLTILNLDLDVTYNLAKENGVSQYVQEELIKLEQDAQIVYDSANNYYRIEREGQDKNDKKRFFLSELYDSSNPEHWRFTANTNNGFWVAGIGGRNITGGDGNVAFVHEIGHNFGLGHEPRLLAQYGPAEKQKIGFFIPEEHYKIISENGTYNILPYGAGSNNYEGLRLMRNNGSYTWIVAEQNYKERLFETGVVFRGNATSPHIFLPTDEEQKSRASILAPTPPVLVEGKTLFWEKDGVFITPTKVYFDENNRLVSTDVRIHFNNGEENSIPTISIKSDKDNYKIYESINFHVESVDADLDSLYYHWKINGEIQLGLFNQPNFEFYSENEGMFIVECTVSDGKGGQNSIAKQIQVGESNPNQTIFSGKILDVNGHPVSDAQVNLAQKFSALESSYFDGLIDVYTIDEQFGLDLNTYEDWSTNSNAIISTVENLDYPTGEGPTNNDVFKAQWNGSIVSPINGLYIALPIDPHKKVKCRLIIDYNNDGIFSPSLEGDDLVCISKAGQSLTNIVHLPEGTYDFRIHYSDSKGSGIVKFPFLQFGLYSDQSNFDHTAGTKFFQDKAYAKTDLNGDFQLISFQDFKGESVFINPFHTDYSIDKSDVLNITLTRKWKVDFSTSEGAQLAISSLNVTNGDSLDVAFYPDSTYILESVIWNGINQALPVSDLDLQKLIYNTPPVTNNSTLHFNFIKKGYGENLIRNNDFNKYPNKHWETTSYSIKKNKYQLTSSNPLEQIIPLNDYFTDEQLALPSHCLLSIDADFKIKDNNYSSLAIGLYFLDENKEEIQNINHYNLSSNVQQISSNLPVGSKFIKVVFFTKPNSLVVKINSVNLQIIEGHLLDNIITFPDSLFIDLNTDLTIIDESLEPKIFNLHSNDKYLFEGNLKTLKSAKTRLLSFNPLNENELLETLVVGSKVNIYLDTLGLRHLNENETESFDFQYIIGVNSEKADNVVSFDNQEMANVIIKGKNDPPFRISEIENQYIYEGAPLSSILLSNYFIDYDQNDSLMFSISNYPPGLEFSNDTLKGTISESGVYSLPILVTDLWNKSILDTVDIFVSSIDLDFDLNEKTINENNTVHQFVGILNCNNPIYTYELLDSNDFIIVEDSLKANKVFDYEQDSTFNIKILATDYEGEISVKSFDISISNEIDLPETLILSNNVIPSGVDSAFIIGEFSSFHPDMLEVSYNIIQNGDEFEIEGNKLITNKYLSYVKNKEIEIFITATDSQGGEFQRKFTIFIEKAFQPINDFLIVGLDTLYENTNYDIVFGNFQASGGGFVKFEILSDTLNSNLFDVRQRLVFLKQKLFLEELLNNPLEFAVKATDEKGNVLVKTFELAIKLDSSLQRWIGVENADWHNQLNWGTNRVPVSNEDVLIPGGTPYDPVISSFDVEIRSLKLLPNSVIVLQGKALIIN